MLAVLKESAAAGVTVGTVEPDRPDGWVLVDMLYAGICGSDLATYRWDRHRHRLRSHLPFVMGHEGVGRVVDGADGLPAGVRVVPEPVLSCFTCSQCVRGRTNLCERAQRLGSQRSGTMAERLAVPADACHIVPDHLSDDQAVLLEVVAVAVHGARRAPEVAGSRCAVVGPGAVGLSMVCVLLAMGAAEIMLVGRSTSTSRLDLGSAAGATGLSVVDDSSTIPASIAGQYDITFETAGSPDGLVAAVELARPGGTVVALGGYHDPLHLDYSSHARYREIDILASRARVPEDWRVMMSMLATGRLDIGHIPTSAVPLADAAQGFALASSGSVLKVVLDCRHPAPTGEDT